MGSKLFHFKRFSVAQDRCTHKVGTDGVLLGAWVNISPKDKRILDIGTGSGLIALMLAQRSAPDSRIDALDIEEHDALQAKENVSQSPWPGKVIVHHLAIQDFLPSTPYDLVVSNPPWFEDSLLPFDNRRRIARHTARLSHGDLLKHAVRLMSADGRLAVILPHTSGLRFIDTARPHGLLPVRKTTFRSRPHKQPERMLLEFAFAEHPVQHEELVLYSPGGEWSDAYRALTREFYLDA